MSPRWLSLTSARCVQQHALAAGLGGVDVDPGAGDQAQLVAGLAQVHGDAGGGRDRPLEARRRALAPVRVAAGCPARRWPGSPRAAPRGAPSAHRSAPSSASAPGAGRRRAGTPGSPRRPRRARPPSGRGCRRCRRTRRPAGPSAAATTCGMTVSRSTLGNERVSSHSPNGSVSRTTSGPTSYRPRTSARTVYATELAWCGAEPLQHHPGAAAQRVRQPVLQQQRAGGQPGQVLQAQDHPGAGADRRAAAAPASGCRPACTGCGRRRPRPAAAATASRTATRSRSFSPRMNAEMAAAPPPRRGRSGRGWSARAAPPASSAPPGLVLRAAVAGRGRVSYGERLRSCGSGSRCTISATIASVVRRASCASAVGMIRWASTGTASACRSSGST